VIARAFAMHSRKGWPASCKASTRPEPGSNTLGANYVAKRAPMVTRCWSRDEHAGRAARRVNRRRNDTVKDLVPTLHSLSRRSWWVRAAESRFKTLNDLDRRPKGRARNLLYAF